MTQPPPVPYPYPSPSTTPRSGGSWIRRAGIPPTILALAGVAAVLVVTAVVLFAAGVIGAQPPITVHGTETVSVNPLDGESAQNAYPDIAAGAQVTVVDPSGKVIGTGTLSASASPPPSFAGVSLGQWDQSYDFTATVPAGEPRYGLQVGHDRGTVWFTEQQMRHGPGLSLGGTS